MDPTTFVFWDTETTGLNKAFHVPVEIGAVITDRSLAPSHEINLPCRPPRNLLAEPGALITTGRAFRELQSRSLSAYAAICEFASAVEATTPTCFVTYNGVRFDDPLIQHTFYRHLHDPYLMMKGGNVRLDLLNIMRFAHAIGVGELVVPTSERGLPVFKLDQLAPFNGFGETGAHSAMVDARALRHLAMLLASHAPEVWQRGLSIWSRKNVVRDLLLANDVIMYFDWDFRRGLPVFKALMPIAPGRSYAGEFPCLDLAFDPDEYASLSPEELADEITVGTKPRPICPVRLNAAPIVLPVDDVLASGRVPLERSVLAGRMRRIRGDAGLRERILDAVELRRAGFQEPEHPEQQLYSGGFISDYDAAVAQRFHAAVPRTKPQVAATFRDARLRYLSEHLIYEEWPEVLDQDTMSRIEAHVRARHLANADAPWTTIASALRDIEKLLPDADERSRRILLAYREHLLGLYPVASAAE
jgi:exodeoxyribonuclease-1